MNFTYWPEVGIIEGLRFTLVDTSTTVLLLHPLAPSAHPCECHSSSFRSLCVESTVRHPSRVGGSPLCLHHKDT